MARSGEPRRQPSIASTFGPGQRSSPVAALVAQQQDQQEQFQKLLQTIEQLQQQNAEQVQMAAEAGAGAATQIANQVASGIDRVNQEKQRGRERVEDRQFAENMQRLNMKLQADAAKEARAMGEAIQAQKDSVLRFVGQFREKKVKMDSALAAFDSRVDEMVNAGWYSSPEGRKRLKKVLWLRDLAKANGDDMFDDRHLDALYRQHNENIQAIISGDDPMDLSTLQIDPLMMPMVETKSSGRSIASEGAISPEKMFELKLHGGYPANGIIFNKEENYGLPQGYSPRMADPATLLEVMQQDEYRRGAMDKSVRQELTRANAKIIADAMDRLKPLKETYDTFNQVFNQQAPGAVQSAIERFMAEPNPNKFNDVGRLLTSYAVQEIYGGGSQGEKMAVIANEIFDGKREPKSDQEIFLAMSLESATYNIQQHMTTEFMNAGDEGGSLATQLVNQMVKDLGEDQASKALGVPNTGVGMVRAQDAMQARLGEARSFANRMHMGMEKISILEQTRQDFGKFTRLADLMSYKVISDQAGDQQRVLDLMGQGAALEESQKGIESMSPDEVTRAYTQGKEPIEKDFNMLDSLLHLAGELGPDVIAQTAAMVTGGVSSPETPNLPAYLNQIRVEHERSGYAKPASTRVEFNYNRQQNAAQARLSGQAVQESFEQGGVASVATEQLPALVSLGSASVNRGAERLLVGTVAGAAGKGPAETALRGYRTGQRVIGAGLSNLYADAPNLTQQERDQVLRESTKPDNVR